VFEPPSRLTGTILSSAAVALAALVCMAAGARGDDAKVTDSCVACHTALGQPYDAPVLAMRNDIHAEKGLSCVHCHGGDATVMDETSMSPEKGFRGKLSARDIPELCGHCHGDEAYMRNFNPAVPTDQLSQYWTSVHGQRLRKGDENVATCVSCHGAHGILPSDRADSPVFAPNVPKTCGRCHSDAAHMAPYGIPTDQQADYLRSVHAEMLLVRRDFSAPACNDCHGNHGAYPPGVASIAGVCGQCHANNAALFLQSPHKRAFDEMDLPECTVCHGNHAIQRASDDMLGGASGAVCPTCHAPGTRALDAAIAMREAIEQLKSAMAGAEGAIARAAAMGMEVGDERYAYNDTVKPRLIKLRTDIHRADPELVRADATEGIAAATASERAAAALITEAQARRRSLFLPLALIVLLMVLLHAKLRQLERRGAKGSTPP
jgi:hypothetical protein